MLGNWLDNVSAGLESNGFFQQPRSQASALGSLWSFIASMQPISIRVDKLRPRDPTRARSNTLSANHGTGAFPPHTDFALRPLPPRYIALFCPVARPGGTTLFSGARLQHASPSGTFRVRTKATAYSTTFANTSRFGPFYRYNADLMKPLDEDALNLATAITLAEPDHIVYWERTAWVIIDNWAILHGRQAVLDNIGWLWRIALAIHT